MHPLGLWRYERARAYVGALRFSSADQFYSWASGKLSGFPAKPAGVPSNPHQVYGSSWVGFADWLGTDTVATFLREWAPFEVARQFTQSLELRSGAEWRLYASGKLPELGTRPLWLPSNPNFVYREEGWSGMRDWLGTGGKRSPNGTKMVPLEEARAFARGLKLKSWVEWRVYVNGSRTDLPAKPANVPAVPHACYKGAGWISYGEFLGCNTTAWHQVSWREFESARLFAWSLQLSGMLEWRAWAKSGEKPNDIPANPEKAYADVWKGWRDWLGT